MHQSNTSLTLDYSSLSRPVTAADLAQFEGVTTHEGRRSARQTTVISYVIMALMCMIGTSFILATAPAFTGGFFSIGVWLVTIGVVVFIAHLFSAYSLRRLVRMNRFASMNNITYQQNIRVGTPAGMVFNRGHSRTIDQVLIFPNGFEIGNYHYTTGSGKHKATHYWSYVHIELPRPLPHMVLDAKQNNFLSLISNLPTGFSRSQVLSLEGDFDKYFTLYAPDTYKTDALYVFTPDVMVALIDYGQDYDIEIIDNSLNLYRKQRFALDSSETLDPLLTIINVITREVGRQGSRYRDGNNTAANANSIAEPGRRLRTNISTAAIVTIVVISAFYLLIIFL